MSLIKMIRIAALLIVFSIFSACFCTINIAAEDSFSWYCKRTCDHAQPPLPEEFEFIYDYGGVYIDKVNSDPLAKTKKIYLTFDAGYENGNISKTLDVLKKNEVKGSFFILSNLIKTSPEIVIRMANEGHIVCNHTSNHKDMSKITDTESFNKEINELEQKYYELTGREVSKFFRPPEGKFNVRTLSMAKSAGYKTVFWSFAYADWDNNSQMSHEKAKEKILSNIHNGAILLLHPTSSTNAAILESVIIELKEQGYTFETLDNLSDL